MSIAPDLKALLKQADAEDRDDRPIYYLWVFDPATNTVHMDHNQDKHPAYHVLHRDLEDQHHIHHPEKIRGYAYSIKGGWRITDDSHSEVKDPFIVDQVMRKLRGEHPEPALPNVRYHRL